MSETPKKKLLVATDAFLPRWDGISRFISELIPPLSKDYDVTVVAPDFPGKRWSYKGVRVVRIPLGRIKIGDITLSRFYWRTISDLVRESDIVFSNSPGPIGGIAMLKAKKYKKKQVSVVHWHGGELFAQSVGKFWAKNRLMKYIVYKYAITMYNWCDTIFVPSEDLGKKIVEMGLRSKVKLIHLGVNTKKFSPRKDKGAYKRNCGLPSDSLVIGFCGRLAREKNIETLYLAFRKLSKSYRGLKLLVVGDGLKEYKDMMRSKKVKLAGMIDNVVPYLNAMDVYVLPSLTETSSLSTMEAMSCGLAVVATPVGSISKYIVHGENGLLFEQKNVKDLVTKLEMLLNSQEYRALLGRNARRSMIRDHKWDETVKEIKAVLAAL